MLALKWFIVVLISAEGSYVLTQNVQGSDRKLNIRRRYRHPTNYKYVAQNSLNDEENLITSSSFLQSPAIQNTKEFLMDALFLLAKNDDLQCVPKILCEVTSGATSGRHRGINLPVNVNLDSFLSFFSSMNGLESSPLIYLRAALLGYSSKADANQCSRTFPACPSDPDKLVQYLNQHNGGFFRYFNGISSSIYAPHYAEERIQSKPDTKGFLHFEDDLQGVPYRKPKAVQPFSVGTQNIIHLLGTANTLKFPADGGKAQPSIIQDDLTVDFRFPRDDNNEGVGYRKPKGLLSFVNEDLNFQRPLPNHKPLPMIFPDRTGTGELKLDPGQLEDHTIDNVDKYRNPQRVGKSFRFP